MTRKDYQDIAGAIADTVKHCNSQDIDPRALGILVTNLIPVMMRDNHRFDEYKFWTACGFMALKK